MNHDNIMMLIIPKAEVCYLYSDDTLRQGLEKMKQYGLRPFRLSAKPENMSALYGKEIFYGKLFRPGLSASRHRRRFL